MAPKHKLPNVRVAAVIVTYRRPQVMKATLESVLQQATPPEAVVVVNNGPEALRSDLLQNDPTVRIVNLSENPGYAGGLAAGMSLLGEISTFDYYWLLDDDSPVERQSLARALNVLQNLPDNAVLANRGKLLKWGYAEPRMAGPSPLLADLVLVDGTLIPRAAIEAVGPPRTDFFMMFEDFELSIRLRRSGFPLYVSDAVRSQPAHLGSGTDNSAWRGYYQTRNHLRAALDLREGRLLMYALVRLSKQVMWQLFKGGDLRGEAIQFRLRGFWDALHNRMGKTVEPISRSHARQADS